MPRERRFWCSCAMRRRFPGIAASGFARLPEKPEELPAGVGEELGIGVIYGMDRRLMAQLLRADAGAVKITDGVIADKRPCRTMEKLLERALVEEAAER